MTNKKVGWNVKMDEEAIEKKQIANHDHGRDGY